jgi:hypothetical protein
MNVARFSLFSLLSCSGLVFLVAAPPSIGMIRSMGDFQVDGSTVRGNATIFEGSTVQTTAVASTIQLSSGTEIVLEPGSRVKLYRDKSILERGAQSIKNSRGHLIEAATLRISPADNSTVAEIRAQDSNRVSIAARMGSVDVRNGVGVLIASVRPGWALAFDTQAGNAPTASKVSGCLVKKGDKYLLTDRTTHVTIELQGPEVAKSAGHQVEITGSMVPSATPAGGASQVVQIVSVDSVGAPCGGSAGGVAAGAGGGAALSTGAIVAIVGGVAAVAATVGLAAAGTFSGRSSPAVSTP